MTKIAHIFLILLLNVGCVGNYEQQSNEIELNKNKFIRIITFLKNNRVDSIKKHILMDNKSVDSIGITRILAESKIILDSYDINKIIRDSIHIIDSIDVPDLDEHMYIYGLNFYDEKGEYYGKIHMTFHSDFKDEVLDFFSTIKPRSSDIDWGEFDMQVEEEMRIYDSLNEKETD